ncbi:MAG: STAS domain-containing protein [Chloroflexi bacterium]|nr:STAS domain-containing protein [Chloroflexota bacterium]
MVQQAVVTLSPQGRLDAAKAPEFDADLQRIVAAGQRQIVVDLAGTRYISSNGLRTLLAAARAAKKQGGAVKLCCLSPRLVEIFEMAGFDRVFEIYASRAEAEKSFS